MCHHHLVLSRKKVANLLIFQDILNSLVIQVSALAASYSFGFCLLLILHFTIGERLKIVGFLNNAMHWLSLFNFIALVLVQFSPYRVLWTLYTIPGCIAFIVWYGKLFVPKRHLKAPSNAISLRVVTFNIAGINEQFKHTLREIQQFDADLIALQEAYHWRLVRPEFPDYPYQISGHSFTLLSRYPFDHRGTRLLGVVPSRTMPVGLHTILNVQGHKISLYIVHPKRPLLSIRPLTYNDRERRAGVDDIVWELENDSLPIIVLGDCNMGYRSEDYRSFSKHLIDSWRTRGFGFGLTAPANPYDTPLPLLRSDIIWHSKHFQTLTVERWMQSGGADHLPVLATLYLKDRQKQSH